MQSQRRYALIPLLLSAILLQTATWAKTPSRLWGSDGSAWTPASRLPDFSFAGYHFGESQIPTVPVAANVLKFGAVGDGKTDNTEAFRKAVESTQKGAILVPAGRYILTGQITITKSGVALSFDYHSNAPTRTCSPRLRSANSTGCGSAGGDLTAVRIVPPGRHSGTSASMRIPLPPRVSPTGRKSMSSVYPGSPQRPRRI
jgi:hypothetical protein